MLFLSDFLVILSLRNVSLVFKKQLSCRHAIYCVRNVIEHYVNNGSTVNVCSLDLSKAFDRMNHYVLFTKLMDRRLPYQLLNLLEHWFSVSVTCVKWGDSYSHFFRLLAGVRQGGVLSPLLFAIFIDSLVDKVRSTGVGCYVSHLCVSIFLYADDILLIAPSVSALQILLWACEEELRMLDMQLNTKKSICIRFGERFKASCNSLVSSYGGVIDWMNSCRYLGVYFVTGRLFSCCFDHAKSKFFRSFNAILSKVGRFASEEVVISLIYAKCLPVLLYSTEACRILVRDKRSLEFTVTRSLMKLFRTSSANIVQDCQKFFRLLPISNLIDIRKAKFLEDFIINENCICRLFGRDAQCSLDKFFSSYSDDIVSTCDLRSVVNDMFFG